MKRLLVTLCAFFLGCSNTQLAGTEIGNPDSVGLQMIGLNGAVAKLSTRLAKSGNHLTEARIVVSEIGFKPLADCLTSGSDHTTEISFEGPYVVDLLNNQSLPSFGTAQIGQGAYCEIEVNLVKLDLAKVPTGVSSSDAIVGKSVLIKGERASDGTPFTVTLDLTQKFRLENETDGFKIDTNVGLSNFIVQFDLASWFANIDLSTATTSGPEIFIDGSNNVSTRDAIILNLKRSAQLFRDQNGDGLLDVNERDISNVLGNGKE